MKRTKRMLCNHRCITEEDLIRQDSGEMSNTQVRVIADKIRDCFKCREISKKFWASH